MAVGFDVRHLERDRRVLDGRVLHADEQLPFPIGRFLFDLPANILRAELLLADDPVNEIECKPMALVEMLRGKERLERFSNGKASVGCWDSDHFCTFTLPNRFSALGVLSRKVNSSNSVLRMVEGPTCS